MEIYVPHDPDEMWDVIDVIKATWGTDSVSSVYKDFMAAIKFHGGLILIAREDGKPVGMQLSIPAYRKGVRYLYSHQTGVDPSFADSNVGNDLKLKQKEFALDNGYDLIAWTFDPARSKNAYFNIGKLNGIARTYILNFYGTMDDELNSGLPTDRLLLEWWIRDPPEKTEGTDYTEIIPGQVDLQGVRENHSRVRVPIRPDLSELKKKDYEGARKLRNGLRDTLRALFEADYAITGFSRDEMSYLLTTDSPTVARHPDNIFR